MMNILNGGAHADSNVDIQEFMIAPIGAPTFREALRWGAEVYHALKSVLKKTGLATGLGDEGGFAPNLDVQPGRARPDRRGDRARPATRSARDIALALDVAASRVLRRRRATPSRAAPKSADEMIAYYAELVDAYPIVSIEDPLDEDDWDGWKTHDRRSSATRSRSSATTCSSPTPSGSQRGIDERHGQRPAGQGQPDRLADRDPRRRRRWRTATATAA